MRVNDILDDDGQGVMELERWPEWVVLVRKYSSERVCLRVDA